MIRTSVLNWRIDNSLNSIARCRRWISEIKKGVDGEGFVALFRPGRGSTVLIRERMSSGDGFFKHQHAAGPGRGTTQRRTLWASRGKRKSTFRTLQKVS